jgi:hypothetical protein
MKRKYLFRINLFKNIGENKVRGSEMYFQSADGYVSVRLDGRSTRAEGNVPVPD